MDDPNITMEEYIRLEEEKARRRGKVYNWETATYGKIWDNKDVHDLRSVETEFLAIVFNDTLTSEAALSPTTSYIDDLDFFNDFENEFPAIVYNDAQTSKSDLLTEPILNPRHIDEFNNETSVFDYDEEEQNILYFNDIFPFNIIRLDDLNSEKDNNDNDIDIIHSSEGNEITHKTNMLMDTSCDKIDKIFNEEIFVLELNVNIVTWTYLFNGMLLCFIMNLYVPFGIPFDPKRYYKDGDCAIMLRRPSTLIPMRRIHLSIRHMALPPREQRHRFLRYEGLQCSDADIADFEGILARIYRKEVHRVSVFDFGRLPDSMVEGLSARMLMEHRDDQGVSLFASRVCRRLFDIRGPLVHELILEFFSTFRFGHAILDLDTPGALQFQLGGVRRHPRQGRSEGLLDRDLYCWRFPWHNPILHYPILRLCHRLIACSIDGMNQAPKKVFEIVCCWEEARAHISGGQFIARLAEHFGLLTAEILGGLTLDDTWAWVAMRPERQPDATVGTPAIAKDALAIDEGDQAVSAPMPAPQQPPPPLVAARTMP
ncbi:hypothetical protein Tco_1114250 [Tanacetum coccineum]|uniref:Uncharacterized protein n=1 Tax=Tanacetum coccineum TaxID=301880 RepID=A0ABQ5IUI3_9ASTR